LIPGELKLAFQKKYNQKVGKNLWPEKEEKMSEILVVVSKVKKLVKDAGFRTGADYIEGLSAKVEEMVKASIEKVKQAGGKKTLGKEDL
jgi:hypothetical protein